MAITRQDYQYVHNTLNKTNNIQSDGVIGIGSYVNNLVPDLSENNIYSPYLSDNPGSKEHN